MSHRLLPGLTSVAFAVALLASQASVASQSGPAVSLPIQICLDKDDGTKDGDAKIVQCVETSRLKDVLFFNHQEGRILYPAPAQLEVEDGAVFTIVFLHTDPTSFDYTLKGLSGPDDKAAAFNQGTVSSPGTNRVAVFVTWRHDRHFPLYQVQLAVRKAAQTPAPAAGTQDKKVADTAKGETLNLRDIGSMINALSATIAAQPEKEKGRTAVAQIQGLQQLQNQLDAQDKTLAVVPKSAPAPPAPAWDPSALTPEQLQAAAAAKHLALVPTVPKPEPLFEYTFPVWVKTTGWNITFNSGFGFSSLTSKKYFIATDSDGKKTVEADPNRGDQSRPDIMALANLTLPHLKNPSLWWAGEKLGIAFGVGLGGDSDARYYFGPSYTLGKRFILNGGWTGGKVSTLPVGQRLHEAPINGDNTLGTLGSRFAHGWYVGISFTFTDDKESDFLNALTPPQQTGQGTATTPPAPSPTP
jgi:hypothetical protein